MRSVFLIALVATVIGAASYFYQVGAAICAVPIAYHIGTIDPEFAITAAEVQAAAKRAEESWEESTGRELFAVTEGRGVAINLEFDERHQRFLEESAFREDLDRVEGMSDEVRANYESLRSQFETERTALETARATYEADLASYNERVASYNDNGGAPPEVIGELEAERDELAARRTTLNQQAAAVNQLVAELNALQAEGNSIIENYNEGVAEFNATFGEPRAFTQGIFRSDGVITVYTYTSEDELALVLAHEFGHALGIGHVEGEQSLMYPMLGAQPRDLSLSQYDVTAFNNVCAERTLWDTIVTGIEEAVTPHYEH